jgi:hypothetical protein
LICNFSVNIKYKATAKRPMPFVISNLRKKVEAFRIEAKCWGISLEDLVSPEDNLVLLKK